jgi:8-oxo-dGTP pyrophosphatase MutT (NUDIX family)
MVEAPKNGAMRRAAAISAPRVEVPTTKTSSSRGGHRRGIADQYGDGHRAVARVRRIPARRYRSAAMREPGQELARSGAPSAPRQAATVIVLRGGGAGLEVLLAERNPAARFMGGAWVFPGGAVDAGEGEGDRAHRLAAVREAREETGIELPDPAALVKFSRWITPPEVRTRFDTHFFLAELPAGQEPVPDGHECVAVGWFTPRAALEAGERGEILLVFPTIKHLEQLEAFASARELLAWADGRDVVPVEPRIVGGGETARVVLPGEPGHGS